MSCRTGTPICELAHKTSSSQVIQMSGVSAASIEISRELRKHYREQDEYTRSYDMMIVLPEPDLSDTFAGNLGKSNKFEALLDLLSKADIDFSRVYVTCLVRCNARKLNSSVRHIKACSVYLNKEIEVLNPKVVLLCGTKSLRSFNIKGSLNAIRGTTFDASPSGVTDKKYKVIPTIDPNYFVYNDNPSLFSRVAADYRKAAKIAKSEPVSDKKFSIPYKIAHSADTIHQIIDEVSDKKFFAFDTESRALPYTKEPMICMSICYGKEDTWVIPLYQHDNLGRDWKLKKYTFTDGTESRVAMHALRCIFENEDISKAAHNIKYDINVIRKHLGFRINGFLYDTMLMHHILYEYRPHDLEYLADLEFGSGHYSQELHEITGKGKVLKATYDNVPDHLLWKYAAIDAYCCARLAQIYNRRLNKKPNLLKLYKDEVLPAIYSLVKAEWRGHAVDKSALRIIIKDYQDEQESLLRGLKSQTWPGFNPNSTKDVSKAIEDAGFGDKIEDDTKISGYSTGKENLGELKQFLPLAGKVLEYRHTTKMLGTYLENIKTDLDTDGRVRYSWLLHATESGRSACKLLHQAPRVDEQRTSKGKLNIRDIFVAEKEHLLVYMDYDQIELRVLTYRSGDKEMLRLFESGIDIHKETASILTGIPPEQITGFNRNLGKTVNFGLAYGSEGYRLVSKGEWEDLDGDRLPISWDMLNAGMRKFKSRFRGVTQYLSSVPRLTRNNHGVLATPFGRERRMGAKLDVKEEGNRKAAEREIVNFSIQSPAASITIRTINLIDSLIDSWIDGGMDPGDCSLVNTVHDSGVWEVREDLVPKFKRDLKKLAERPIPELDNHIFPCKIGVGRTWSQAEGN